MRWGDGPGAVGRTKNAPGSQQKTPPGSRGRWRSLSCSRPPRERQEAAPPERPAPGPVPTSHHKLSGRPCCRAMTRKRAATRERGGGPVFWKTPHHRRHDAVPAGADHVDLAAGCSGTGRSGSAGGSAGHRRGQPRGGQGGLPRPDGGSASTSAGPGRSRRPPSSWGSAGRSRPSPWPHSRSAWAGRLKRATAERVVGSASLLVDPGSVRALRRVSTAAIPVVDPS